MPKYIKNIRWLNRQVQGTLQGPPYELLNGVGWDEMDVRLTWNEPPTILLIKKRKKASSFPMISAGSVAAVSR